jgi:lambda family phage portal protein
MGKRRRHREKASLSADLAMVRAKARGEILRAFDGASQSRRTDGWVTSNQGPNADIKPMLNRLIQRHQDLADSNPWIKRAIDVVVSNWIGDGIMGAAGPGGTKLFGKQFQAWSESTDCDFYGRLNFYGLQELWTRTTVVRGSAIIRKRLNPQMFQRGLVPLQLQVLEPDWLDTSRDDGQYLIGGKQFDEFGREQGAWFRLAHPGENTPKTGYTAEYVPKSEYLHTYEMRRPGQYTGVPMGVTALLRARDLDDYEAAELLKQKIAACFTAFRIKADLGEGVSSDTDIIETLEPGAIEELGIGESIAFSNPPRVEGYGEFMRMNLHAIAVSYGITYEALTGILSDVNFSSGRMGWLEFARNVARWRWNITVPQVLDPIGSWFIETAKITGQIRGPQKLIWTPPRREMINPAEEIKWMVEAIQAGFMTRSECQRSFGFVPSDLLDEYQADQQDADQRGLVFSSDMRVQVKAHVAAGPTATPPANPNASPTAAEPTPTPPEPQSATASDSAEPG